MTILTPMSHDDGVCTWCLQGRESLASSADAARRLEGTASASGRPGVPVKVQVHKKVVKELAELYLVQEIHAHQGDPSAVPRDSLCLTIFCLTIVALHWTVSSFTATVVALRCKLSSFTAMAHSSQW